MTANVGGGVGGLEAVGADVVDVAAHDGVELAGGCEVEVGRVAVLVVVVACVSYMAV